MTRFLIEVPHENKKEACERAVRVFSETGSHFMTNADWGCADDEHKAWIIVDLDSKDEARALLPPLFRPRAKITTLQKFTMEEVDQSIEQHED
jgi:hypothetical protein